MSEDKNKRFVKVSDCNKKQIYEKRKAKNTNDATRLWVNCFKEYLSENSLADIDEISNEQLSDVLTDFYVEVKNKRPSDTVKNDDKDSVYELQSDVSETETAMYYKTSTLRAIHGSLTRYFKDIRKLDIRNNELFIEANQMFIVKTKDNKEKGLGKIDNKPPINDTDMSKLTSYFQSELKAKPNPLVLEQSVIFNIIYYLCRRGRVNLRIMKKSTFEVAIDPENNKKYIYQAVDEAHKNHTHDDTSIANQGRIYEIPGKVTTVRSTPTIF